MFEDYQRTSLVCASQIFIIVHKYHSNKQNVLGLLKVLQY